VGTSGVSETEGYPLKTRVIHEGAESEENGKRQSGRMLLLSPQKIAELGVVNGI
jgi:hypothetical protein